MSRGKVQATIDGRPVEVEVIERPDRVPFVANPEARDLVLFLAGTGVGLYRVAHTLTGFIPNPSLCARIKSALPWVAGAALGFVVAPVCNNGREVVRAISVGAAGMAIYKFFTSAPAQNQEQKPEVKKSSG